jgi:acyl-CoA thioesterase
VLSPRRTGDGAFEGEVPDGWQQGRGAFGGLVLGLLVRGVLAEEAAAEAQPGDDAAPSSLRSPRSLRSMTAEIMGPVQPGPVRIAVEGLRRGSGVSTVRAQLVQDGGVLAHAVVVLGKARAQDASWQETVMPVAPPGQDLTSLLGSQPFAPRFAKNFVFRNTGPLPYCGGSEARTAGWIAPRAPARRRDAAFMTALIDAWWPACFSILKVPRPVATLTFMLELFGEPPADEDPTAPLYFCGRAPVACEGYSSEERQLFSAGGRLLALNHQVMTLIK